MRVADIRGDPTPIHTFSGLNAHSELLVGRFQSEHLQFSAVIDTGATISFIPAQGLIPLSLKPRIKESSTRVQAANNQCFTSTMQTELYIRPVNIDMAPVRSRVLIVADCSDLLAHDMIIGNLDIKSLQLAITN